MKKILLFLLLVISLKVKAQPKLTWQAVIEANGNIGSGWLREYINTNYRMIDSAANLFSRYHLKSVNKVNNSMRFGGGVGIRINCQLGKNIYANIGLAFFAGSLNRVITFSTKLEDSSINTLQREAGHWLDPSNGLMVYNVYGNSPLDGTYSGVTLTRPGDSYPGQKYPCEETIRFSFIELPLGLVYSLPKSRFSVCAEICPGFLLKGSVTTTYKYNNEVVLPISNPKEVNSLVWKLSGGINYKINKRVSVGVKYKQSLNTLVDYDDIKYRSFAAQLTYSLPGIKL